MTDYLQQAYSYFRNQGYSRGGAAGIVSNLRYESGMSLNPLAANLSGSERGGALSSGGIGIAQWNGARQSELLNFAQSIGQPWSSRSTQLAFVDQELRQRGLFGALSSDISPASAAALVTRKYEIPADMTGAIAVRGPFAEQIASSSGGGFTLQPSAESRGAFGLGGANPDAAGGGIAVTPETPRGSTQGQFLPASAGGAFGALSGMWEAMGVTAVSTAGKAVAESNKESAAKIAGQVDTSTKAAVAAGTSWLDTALAATRDLFVRGGLAILGALLLLGGVLYFSRKGD